MEDTLFLQENAAIQLQYWWRKCLRNRSKNQEQKEWKTLKRITLANDELLRKMEELQSEKMAAIQKYERLINLPANEINVFLENMQKGGPISNQSERFDQKEMEKREQAARIIQKRVRAYQLRTRSQAWSRECDEPMLIPKRITLITQINERLINRPPLRAETLLEVKRKLHNRLSHTNGKFLKMASIEKQSQHLQRFAQTVEDLGRLSLLKSEFLTPLNIRPLSTYKATQHHKEDMKTIHDHLLML